MSPPARPPIASLVWLGLLAGPLLLVALKWSTVHDPQYWDALACYVVHARFMAQHGFDLASYHELPYIRPPVFTGLLAVARTLLGPAREVLHVVTLLLSGLLLPATYAVARQLGGSVRTGMLAALLCLCAPLYLAQAGLVQSDLPATTFATLAWLLLLEGRALGFALVGSIAVLTKESTVFLCGPAALLLWERARSPGEPFWRWRHLGLAMPAAVPGLVLLAWLLLHRVLSGTAMSAVHQGYVGYNFLAWALVHNLLDGGRFLLLPLALLLVWQVRRPGQGRAPLRRREILCTALAVLLLPFIFPAPLPRYMLLSLPLLCALAALGIQLIPASWRAPAAAGLLVLLAAGAGGLYSKHDIAHLEASQAYRGLIASHREAAQALWAAQPRRVISGFPMHAVLSAPAEDGYLPSPLPVDTPELVTTDAELCKHDFLIEAQDGTVAPVLLRLRRLGVATLWKQLGPPPGRKMPPFEPLSGEEDQTIRIYHIDCGGRS